MRNLVMELIGTFFLVLAIGLSGNPVAIGLTLAIMIYIGGHVSGAHYNPAVSLAVWARGRLDAATMVQYWAAQLLGAVAGAGMVYVILGTSFAPAPSTEATLVAALLVEILFTFALASAVLNIATTTATQKNHVYGFVIGLTVTAGALSGGPVSGGAFNPAVGTGPALVHALSGGGFEPGHLVLYWVGPLAGGFLAAAIYRYLQPSEVSD